MRYALPRRQAGRTVVGLGRRAVSGGGPAEGSHGAADCGGRRSTTCYNDQHETDTR